MTFRSIRSRLALSFAGIALVAAIALGAVLLAILQNFYSNMEMDYLHQNAEAVGGVVAKLSTNQTPPKEVQLQIQNLAFLTQTRIQVYNQNDALLYDSGSPAYFDVNLGVIGQRVSAPALGQPPGGASVIMVAPREDQAFVAPGEVPAPGGELPRKDFFLYSSVQAKGSPFGFTLNTEAPSSEARSRLEVQLVVQRDGQKVIIRLSEGPAYGSDVLTSVAWGWVLASAIAVLLAAAVGSYISRRISAPVLALTGVTANMAKGDLSSRADVNSRDELGQLARSFNEMADKVETTVTTLRRFVSDAAHELRTPLTALRTNLDLALDENNATDRVAFLSRAQLMVKRLEELNTNLLDLSRLEANGHTAEESLVDLTGFLQQRSELYASQAEQAELVFEVKVPSMPVLVRTDPGQVARAMDNLVDNACKFTLPGGTVRVALSEQGGQAVFSVEDTGIGIPAGDLPHLFNRFHRGRNTNTFPGSGLGLAIVKAIVTAQGGEVNVESAGEGKGSRFSFGLPMAPSQEK